LNIYFGDAKYNRIEDVFKMDSIKILIKTEGKKIDKESYADFELFSIVIQQG